MMIARSKIKAAAVALYFIHKSAVPWLWSASAAFTPTVPSLKPKYADGSFRLSQSILLQLNSVDDATDTDNACPSAAATSTSKFQIREAEYSDLSQAADLMTDGFYPELRRNPIMRPIRYLLELDRLQGNFPYEEDGRHFYLIAYEEEEGDTTTETKDGNRKVVGFCDIDGRIPKAGSNNTGFLSSFVKRVRRPQPYFSDLIVNPDNRRQGIASALMTEAERRAKSMGFDELYLGVRSTNDLALRMYSKIGYEIIIPWGDMLAFLEIQPGVRMLRRSL
mmetsp:Transcript_10724/g.23755  ORF Transcript_10724/g.23755 Transcript_10724/m.23755 type:complete len:278 (+) Transcript_10724:71-904(+)